MSAAPQDSGVKERLQALEGRPKPALIEAALGDPSFAVRSRAVELAAQQLSPVRLVALVAAGDDFARRASAINALGRAGTKALPALLEAVEEGGAGARIFCLQALGRIKAPEAFAALCRASSSADTLVAQAAIESLGVQGDPAAVPFLVAALDQDHWRGMAAIVALGRIRDPRAVEALRACQTRDRFAEVVTDLLARLDGARRPRAQEAS